jgi:hypothetical protein
MKLMAIKTANTQVSFRSFSALDRTTRTLLSFASLCDGWHYGAGVVFSRPIIDTALFVQSRLVIIGSTLTEAFPLVTGNILIVGYNGDEEIEVTCRTDGGFDVSHFLNDEAHFSCSFSNLNELYIFLGTIAWKSKKLSGWFILGTTATTRNDSQVQPFANHLMVQERQSSPLPAPFRQIHRNATMYENTTAQVLPVNHPFFYAYKSQTFLTTQN